MRVGGGRGWRDCTRQGRCQQPPSRTARAAGQAAGGAVASWLKFGAAAPGQAVSEGMSPGRGGTYLRRQEALLAGSFLQPAAARPAGHSMQAHPQEVGGQGHGAGAVHGRQGGEQAPGRGSMAPGAPRISPVPPPPRAHPSASSVLPPYPSLPSLCGVCMGCMLLLADPACCLWNRGT